MMAITFGEVEDTDADPFSVNDGRIVFYPNWYNTSRLGQLRERTFVAAPITYSAYRFARSLYGNKGYDELLMSIGRHSLPRASPPPPNSAADTGGGRILRSGRRPRSGETRVVELW